MAIIHVLGADIPHHNKTLLAFFNEVLTTEVPCSQARKFIVVTQDIALAEQYPNLSIDCVTSKKQLAKVVTDLAKNRQTLFFCHGQFNPYLWLALLSGRIRRHQLHWHIWGADLYEASRSLKFRLFYILRRRAQGRVAAVYATLGDLSVYQQKYPKVTGHKLYFPTKMATTPQTPVVEATTQPLTILLGNSGDPTNRHCQALTQIAQRFGQEVKVIIPMGYPDNNDEYIARVNSHASQLFPLVQVEILTEKLMFDAYLKVVDRCHLGYFIFARQQGIGTLSLLIDKNIPFVISRKNPFWRDLAEQQLPVLFDEDSLDRKIIQRARQQLTHHDKTTIEFFSPGYIQGWRDSLQRLEEMELS
ncbi:dTDP-N-acetylfucosamine:lipid II N-acetylfucosaminyltransferase [Rosenbergiella nectarea]|uniref:dTDP-N-acetylfucosamine:lipid II N-acetylfucosaminyltransferase n=1 Tax=Rosenbergiella nectarea TaxID=988801 RepID=A0A1H9JVP3_9GAMM|nr:TDP-N-acetylfucosamine:lipid II N-acetylfucosaminyltransferase [Rosenbergiella nectarea]SEQ90857.1 dTDP-N-acetylfucosamine:lipid II N-acetylfucosaminyltransferase [Rosenbergiella nectarea]